MPRHSLPSCSPASGLLRRPSRRLVGARLRATRGLQGKDRPRENRPHAYAAPDSARPLRPGRRAWLMRGRFRGVPRHNLPSCSPASGLLRRPSRRLVGARLRATRGLQGKDRPRENRPHAYAAPDSARPLRPGRRAWLMRGRFRGVPRHSLPSCSPASGLLRRPPRRLVGARLRATRGLQGKDRPRENRPHA
jgi:hypothetical protein